MSKGQGAVHLDFFCVCFRMSDCLLCHYIQRAHRNALFSDQPVLSLFFFFSFRSTLIFLYHFSNTLCLFLTSHLGDSFLISVVQYSVY